MAVRELKPGETVIPLAAGRPRVRELSPDETVIPDSTLVQQFGGAANRVLASLIDLPGRLAHAVVDPVTEAITGHETPPPTNLLSETLRSHPLLSAPPPITQGQRIAARAGEEIGAALPFMAMPLVSPLTRGASALGRGWNALIEAVRRQPGLTTAGEATAALGAGLGGGAAREAAPDDPRAEMLGELSGALLAPAIATNLPGQIAFRLGKRFLWDRFSPRAQRAAAEGNVSELVTSALADGGSEGLDRARALRRTIRGFNPTLAQATDSQSLKTAQVALEAQAQGPELDEYTRRYRANQRAVETFAEEAAPAAPAGDAVEIVVDTARGRVENLRAEAARQIGKNLERQEDLAATLPLVNQADEGARLRGRLTEMQAAAREEMAQLAQDLGINDVGVSVPFQAWRERVLEEFKPSSVFADRSARPPVLGLIRELDDKADVTFADLKALRERVSDDLRDALASGTNHRLVRNLVQLQGRVDDLIRTIPDDAFPNPAAYREFRKRYAEDYIQRFRVGTAFHVKRQDGTGIYRSPDEQVAVAFFRGGGITAARDFKRAFRDDPEAMAAMEAIALDNLRDAAVRDGRIQPKLLETWLRKHREVLDEFPALREQVSTYSNTTDMLMSRQRQLQDRARKINDTLLARQLERVAKGKTPDDFLATALRDKRVMQQLVGSLDKRGREALRRAVWDNLSGLSGGELSAYLKQHADALGLAASPKHLANLRTIAEARTMLERVGPPYGQSFDPNPIKRVEEFIGTATPSIQNRMFAVANRRVPVHFVGTDLAAKFLRASTKRHNKQLIQEALYNPDVAEAMASLVRARTEDAASRAARRVSQLLFNLGIPFVADGSDASADREIP